MTNRRELLTSISLSALLGLHFGDFCFGRRAESVKASGFVGE